MEHTHRISGIKINWSSPITSHLLFADDCYIFSKVALKEAEEITDCQKKFSEASGQTINQTKSEIIFSQNTFRQFCQIISSILNIKQAQNLGNYLGLPSSIGRDKISLFAYIEKRIRLWIQGWKGKLLSQDGNEILLKSVVVPIPSYAMSCFLIPKSVCNSINTNQCRFWWGNSDNYEKINWVARDKMQKSKKAWGMGFRDFYHFNLT